MLVSPYTGRKLASPTKRAMTLDKHKRFMEFETILRDCGWVIRCTACDHNVSGDNSVGDHRLSVKCGCSVHTFDAAGN